MLILSKMRKFRIFQFFFTHMQTLETEKRRFSVRLSVFTTTTATTTEKNDKTGFSVVV
jgi:hypothetical protein